MLTVYKYPLKAKNQEIMIDPDFEVVLFELQGREICLWAKVDTDKVSSVKIHCTDTGERVESGLKHIGSVQCGPYVFHFWRE